MAAVIAVAMLGGPVLLADPTFNGNGGIFLDRLGWDSHPSGSTAGIFIGSVTCQQTCGVVKIEIDWDDGTVDRFYTSLPATPNQTHTHQYADNGLRHAKIRIEDEDPYNNWLSVEPIDITIQH
jgi:hypothetical protein